MMEELIDETINVSVCNDCFDVCFGTEIHDCKNLPKRRTNSEICIDNDISNTPITNAKVYKKQKIFNQIEDSQNVENTEIEISSTKWNEEKTKLLISLYRDMENQFENPHQGKKIKLWCLLAEKMAVHKYIETGKQCDAKWRTLKTRYKENKKKALQSGEGKITWPYFNLMDSFLSKKAYISPPVDSLLGSKLPTPTKHQSTATITSSSNSISTVKKPSTSKNLFENIDLIDNIPLNNSTHEEIDVSNTEGLTTYCGHQDSDDSAKSKKKLKDKNISSLLSSLIDQRQEMIDFFKAKDEQEKKRDQLFDLRLKKIEEAEQKAAEIMQKSNEIEEKKVDLMRDYIATLSKNK